MIVLPKFRFPSRTWIPLMLLTLTLACKKEDEVATIPFIVQDVKTYEADYGWNCASGVDCQDVFELELEKGAKLNFKVGTVSAGSAAQIALYAPSVALGSINLFTMSAKELRCNAGKSCSDFTAGETISGFVVPQSGTYLLAITREWGTSCGGTGTYKLTLGSDRNFSVRKQSFEDTASIAAGFECVK